MTTSSLLVLCIGFVIATLLSTAAGALSAAALGIGVPRVQFGVWGPQRTWQFGATALRVSPWWIGGWVAFKTRDLESTEATPGRYYEDTSRFTRFLVSIAGSATLLIGCACVLGAGEASASLLAGIVQLFAGALGPLSTAQSMLAQFAEMVAIDPVRACAVFTTKWIATGLVPFVGGAGANALIALLPVSNVHETRWFGVYGGITILVMLAVMASWIVALVAWVI